VETNDTETLAIIRSSGAIDRDGEQAAATLRLALRLHRAQIKDPAAVLQTRPLTQLESAADMDAYGHVSGYRSIHIDQVPDNNDGNLDTVLSIALSEAPLSNLLYEGIWGLGNVLVYYVRGQLVTEPGVTSQETP